MKIMHCPLNGPRNISEFTYGGELKEMIDQNTCSDEAWADYVFNTRNIAGVVLEWWMHTPSSYWFIAERHTVTDKILRTFDAKALFSQRIDFSAPEATATVVHKESLT
ncbi:sarcosine oxidase subunit delta [Acinetobacter sp. S40]|uniref:sarcosine oxidase subunit delta n=1 Tax=unclassified Acinetobacter TaxID=196816 RepID=UPI00190C6C02|nr:MULTISPECIES: sarcosine oxidase subunit delta [unclassified Acinetobacter]MBJ9984702.1 sarcosine oxidase subunit delta [Acinetobacter sp. S40]MBK0062467.1 sarcosine oxidase subunit delta [Acinetobacter sp. S55]MBK0066271.1 sarcosine oxidase subunit delta [Acinetobacter sp. S54]